jgi:hypothetical protein
MSDLKPADIKFPKIRRVGAEHYTEHDFEMERIGAEQNRETYEEHLAVLESHGWVPFNSPFYYAGREFHGGHHPPGTKKYVPTKVAFAMFKETNPDVELPKYRPHPHGWSPPPSPGMGFKTELVKLQPLSMPLGALFTMDYEYGTAEEIKERRARKQRLDDTFKDVEGIRSYGVGRRYPSGGKAYDYVHVKLEHEGARSEIPERWEELPVEVEVRPEEAERAEKEARDKAAREQYEEEAAWLRKARLL